MRYHPLFNLFIIFFLILTLATGCKKEEERIPLSGKITGTIQTWDDKLVSTTDAEGFTVTITSLPNTSTTTDANGKFSFENLPYDQYDFSFTKSGYGTFRIYGLTHQNNPVGLTNIPLIGMGRTSTTTITNLEVKSNTLNGEPGVSFNYAISPAPSTSSRAFVRYFLGKTPDVSNTNYTAYSNVINFSNLSNNTGFTTTELIGMGFQSGQTVYVKLYGDSFKSNDYLDPNTGIRIFPNLNPTTVPAVSFVIP